MVLHRIPVDASQRHSKGPVESSHIPQTFWKILDPKLLPRPDYNSKGTPNLVETLFTSILATNVTFWLGMVKAKAVHGNYNVFVASICFKKWTSYVDGDPLEWKSHIVFLHLLFSTSPRSLIGRTLIASARPRLDIFMSSLNETYRKSCPKFYLFQGAPSNLGIFFFSSNSWDLVFFPLAISPILLSKPFSTRRHPLGL